jgi:hypothetical protein
VVGVRPIVFLDVDGPLNLWASGDRPAGFVEHRFRVSRWGRRRLRMWLNPGHGPMLLGLAERTGAELVWASTWGPAANGMVGRALGLPELRSIDFVAGSALGDGEWKYPSVVRFARDRPLVWFDDDFDLYPAARDAFVAKRGGERARLVRVDPHVGITEVQVADVEAWLRVVGTV